SNGTESTSIDKCKESLKELSTVNSLRLEGHEEIDGNEIANDLARKGSVTPGGESLNLLGRSVKPPMKPSYSVCPAVSSRPLGSRWSKEGWIRVTVLIE
uniref:Uncharacterized protein n=1 Tax=Megaselia scalaris TaxID=36166 RepID=T1GYK5_MEGSC